MISSLLKIATFALICCISFAGITFEASDPKYDNQRIYKFETCDHTLPTEFPPAYKSYFNCTNLVVLNNGNLACDDYPCEIMGSRRDSRNCVWIAGTMEPTFPEGGRAGITYTLTPCRTCLTEDCKGRYYWDLGCRGKMVTKDYGKTWICSDPSCSGETKLQVDGTYACISSTPTNTDSSSSLVPWAIVGLLSIAVIYQAYQKRNQEKSNQYNAPY